MDFKIDVNSVPSSIKCILFSLMSPKEIENYSVVEINKAENPEWIVFPYEEWW